MPRHLDSGRGDRIKVFEIGEVIKAITKRKKLRKGTGITIPCIQRENLRNMPGLIIYFFTCHFYKFKEYMRDGQPGGVLKMSMVNGPWTMD